MKSLPKSTLALLIAAGAAVLFAFFIQPFPHAGESAMILAQKLGIDPFPAFRNPLYGWIVKGIAAVSGSAQVYAINAFSAVCGAFLLSLVFALVYRATRSANHLNAVSHPAMHRIQAFAGASAVLLLLAAGTFWKAATQAGPLTFDLCLLLSAFYLVISYTDKSGPARIVLAALLYGVAIVEFSTAILISPVFLFLVLEKLYVTGSLRARVFWAVAGAGTLGLSLYLLQAGLFMLTPAYELREFKSFFQVIWYIWLEQYQGLVGGLPRVGWLTIGLVSFLPWLITSGFQLKRDNTRNKGADVGNTLLNAIFVVLAVFMVRDFSLAPQAASGTSRLIVTPYILIALWFGNVVAFWLVALFRAKRFEGAGVARMRRVVGVLFLAAFPVYFIVTMITLAIPQVRSPFDRIAHAFVVEVVDAAADKEWLLTATVFDDQIALEALRRDLPLKIVRLNYGRSKALMNYVATLFSDNPRLESLARVGMEPLVDRWLATTPLIEEKLAILNVPDFWLAAGFEAVPDRVLFTGARNVDEIPFASLTTKSLGFWAGMGAEIIALESDQSQASYAIEWIKHHLSRVANNFGVFLEDHGQSIDDARAAYQQARLFVPDNLSALMNLHVLAGRANDPELADLEKELIDKTEELAGRVQVNNLAQTFGFVRVPEVFARRGMAFAMSGKAALAVSEIKRAIELAGNSSPQLDLVLAGLYFGQAKDVQSKEQYERVLERDPSNASALLGLLRLAMRAGDIQEGRRLLQVLKDTVPMSPALRMEEAYVEALSGAPTKALRILQEVVKEDPKNIAAWSGLAAIATEMKDNKVAEEAIKVLQDSRVFSPATQMIMTRAALNRNDREGARRHLGELLRRQPSNMGALQLLLNINLAEGKRDEAHAVVERILAIDPSNALGNYMLGMHHYLREEYLLAESAYRASLETTRSAEALNDLAYVLHIQGRTREAEPLIRESLGINPKNENAWDTLGVILMNLGNLEEAEKALQQSLALRPDAPAVMLSLAQLYEKTGRMTESEALARQVNARQNELSPQSQGQIRELIRRLDDR